MSQLYVNYLENLAFPRNVLLEVLDPPYNGKTPPSAIGEEQFTYEELIEITSLLREQTHCLKFSFGHAVDLDSSGSPRIDSIVAGQALEAIRVRVSKDPRQPSHVSLVEGRTIAITHATVLLTVQGRSQREELEDVHAKMTADCCLSIT